jgi:RimJ/RimL family protein N-acetyltransferase
VLPTPPEGLRHWRPEDAPALAAAWADPDITRGNQPPPDLDPAAWIAGTEVRWARRLALDLVIDAGRGEVAGEVGLAGFTTDPARAELGVWVAASHRRTGLGTRAVRTVTAWALDPDGLGLEHLWARTDPANVAAESLFAGLGWDRLGPAGAKTIWSATAAVLR